MTKTIHHREQGRALKFEDLERRVVLSGEGVVESPPEPTQDTCDFTLRDSEAARATHAVNCFATDLYEHYVKEEGNLLVSPFSISTALAMTAAGASGETLSEMSQVLHLGEGPEIHQSFRALLESLEGDATHPHLANALWPQNGFPLEESFVELLASSYRGYAQYLNYASDPESARESINNWVEQETQERIRNLIPQGAIDELTRLTLTNAIYFKANWLFPFADFWTADRPFYREDGVELRVPTMFNGTSNFSYTEVDGFQVIRLPFAGEVDEWGGTQPGTQSMVIMLPQEGYDTDDLTSATIAKVDDWLESKPGFATVNLQLPKFSTTISSDLKTLLAGMGASQMFDPDRADFSGMTVADDFHINEVLHKTFIAVNESGVEAAGATAVIGGVLCFAAGTSVATPEGERPIETLGIGDMVLSRADHDVLGRIEPKRIEQTFKHETEIVAVHVEGGTVRTTAKHPFFVRDQGWTSAEKLVPGDMLATDLRSWTRVEHVEATGEVETVYNFHVADHHTYFVGGQSLGCNLWVHNTCGATAIPKQFIADHPFHFLIRDDVTSAILFMGRIDDPSQEENSVTPEVSTEVAEERLLGDIDGDNDVDFQDFLILAQHFGKEEDAVFAEGDFNSDGAVDFADFLVLQENFNARRDSVA